MKQAITLGREGREHRFEVEQLKERTRQYYKCYQATYKGSSFLLFQLIGAAAPFIPLLELFSLFALSTDITVTHTLVRFIISSWQAYQQCGETAETFKQQFFSANLQGREQIESIINKVTASSPQQLAEYAAEVSADSRYKGVLLIDKSYADKFRRKEEKSLSSLAIVPHGRKMEALKRQCAMAGAEVWFEKGSRNVYIKKQMAGSEKGRRLISLEEMLVGSCVSVVANQLEMEQLFLSLTECVWQAEKKYGELCPFDLDLRSVFVEVVPVPTKDGHRFALVEGSCLIDYLHPFLAVLGLSQRPYSIQNLVAVSRPGVLRCHASAFDQPLREKGIEARPAISVALAWILIADCLLVRAGGGGRLALIQVESRKEKLLDCLLGPGQQLHPLTRTLLSLLKQSSPQFPQRLSLEAICGALQEGEGEEVYEARKYSNIRNSLQLRARIISQGEGLRHFWERSKTTSFKSEQRALFMYLLGKYALLESERQFLQLWPEESPSQLLCPQYGLLPTIRLMEQFCGRIKEKVKEREGLFQQLSDYSCFGTDNKYSNADLLRRTAVKLGQMASAARMQGVRQEGERAAYLAACRSYCLFQLLAGLTLENYSGVRCEYERLLRAGQGSCSSLEGVGGVAEEWEAGVAAGVGGRAPWG